MEVNLVLFWFSTEQRKCLNKHVSVKKNVKTIENLHTQNKVKVPYFDAIFCHVIAQVFYKEQKCGLCTRWWDVIDGDETESDEQSDHAEPVKMKRHAAKASLLRTRRKRASSTSVPMPQKSQWLRFRARTLWQSEKLGLRPYLPSMA
jgi:hypothetical protein